MREGTALAFGQQRYQRLPGRRQRLDLSAQVANEQAREEEGLVDGQPNHRIHVTGFDPSDLEYIYSTRILLESLTVALTGPSLVEDDIHVAEQVLYRMRRATQHQDFRRVAAGAPRFPPEAGTQRWRTDHPAHRDAAPIDPSAICASTNCATRARSGVAIPRQNTGNCSRPSRTRTLTAATRWRPSGATWPERRCGSSPRPIPTAIRYPCTWPCKWRRVSLTPNARRRSDPGGA